jgi:hypothetical protein
MQKVADSKVYGNVLCLKKVMKEWVYIACKSVYVKN